MIWHQAVSQEIKIFAQFLSDLFQKKQIIFVIEEYPAPVVASVINVVDVICIKFHKSRYLDLFKDMVFSRIR
jgi:hypothetical protein